MWIENRGVLFNLDKYEKIYIDSMFDEKKEKFFLFATREEYVTNILGPFETKEEAKERLDQLLYYMTGI